MKAITIIAVAFCVTFPLIGQPINADPNVALEEELGEQGGH